MFKTIYNMCAMLFAVIFALAFDKEARREYDNYLYGERD